MNFAFDWAKAALFAIEGEGNLAERLWSGVALSIVRAVTSRGSLESVKRGDEEGRRHPLLCSAPGGENAERAGPVETSLYLVSSLRLPQRYGPATRSSSGSGILTSRRSETGSRDLVSGGLIPSSPDVA